MRLIRKICIIIAVIVLAVLWGSAAMKVYRVAAAMYDEKFSFRCTTDPEDAFTISDFPGLTRERHTFASNKGQTLVGYLYQQEDASFEKKAVVVFAHGLGGGGQTGYMDMFAYLAKQGYYVFAYDATGNDESEGEVIGGLPQGVIDLDYAINYAYSIEEIAELPVVLMGYSWGGFSVVNVLNYHPEVRAVASIAGFNKSTDLVEYYGSQVAGDKAKLIVPFVTVHEYLKFGKYAFSSAMNGFAKSDCDVMIVHGKRDTVVPFEYGYGTYYEKYGNDERFTFKSYRSRGHDLSKEPDGDPHVALLQSVVDFFDQSLTE